MNRLKELRKGVGLTQQAIADMLSVRQNTYSNWERGVIQPGVDVVESLSSFYNVSTDYLLGFSDQQKKPTGNATPDELVESPLDAELRSVFYSLNPDDQKFFLDMMRHRSST